MMSETLKRYDKIITSVVTKMDVSIRDFAAMSKQDVRFEEYRLCLEEAKKDIIQIQIKLCDEFGLQND